MIFTPRLDKAIKLATHLHRNQTRRDGDFTPYVSHLYSVAVILSEVTDDEDIIIAGLMHDSLEDIADYNYENLLADCGERVAEIVKHVTEPLDGNKSIDDQLPWLKRKEVYLENLKSGGKESALVSAADKIHNTISFMDDLRKDGEVFLKKFHSGTQNKIWFNMEVISIIENKLGGDHALVEKLITATKDFESELRKYEQN